MCSSWRRQRGRISTGLVARAILPVDWLVGVGGISITLTSQSWGLLVAGSRGQGRGSGGTRTITSENYSFENL